MSHRFHIQIRRAYEPPQDGDGFRVFVDRLWPRGLSKEKAALDEWVKELGPSTELRHWFGHDPARWDEFRRRYDVELAGLEQLWRPLLDRAATERVCLLFGAHDSEHNQAVALREFLLAQ